MMYGWKSYIGTDRYCKYVLQYFVIILSEIQYYSLIFYLVNWWVGFIKLGVGQKMEGLSLEIGKLMLNEIFLLPFCTNSFEK